MYGLIFLFKWQKEADNRPVQQEEEYHGKVFFAEQVITNACGTQALLSVLLNRPDIELGKELTDLRNFTADFPPSLRGQAHVPLNDKASKCLKYNSATLLLSP